MSRTAAARRPRRRNLTAREALAQAIENRRRRDLDTSTPERILRDGGELVIAEDGKRQLVHQSIIDRLLARGRISKRQNEAGDKLRMDMTEARLDGNIHTVSWDSTARADIDAAAALTGYTRERCLDARQRYRKAVEAVGIWLFPVLELAVLVAPPGFTMADVGGKLFGRAGKGGEASALEVLRLALNQLADHYFGRDSKQLERIARYWRPAPAGRE
jgi:hypothetical protein